MKKQTALYQAIVGAFVEMEPPELLFPDSQWLQDTLDLCSVCKYIKRSIFPKKLDIVLEATPENGVVGQAVETTGVMVWHKDFLDYIKEYLSGFVIGHCFLPDGFLVQDYMTCYSKQYCVIRGGKFSHYQICQSCGTVISNVEPGPQYILQRSLSDLDVYQDVSGKFLFTEQVADMFKYRGFEVDENSGFSMHLEPISIREIAGDSKRLPEDV